MNLNNVSIQYKKISSEASLPGKLFEELAGFLYDSVSRRLDTKTEQEILSCWLEEDIFSEEEGISGATEEYFWLTFTRCGAGIGAHWFTIIRSLERVSIEALLMRHGYELVKLEADDDEWAIEDSSERWFFFILDAASCDAKTGHLAEVQVDTKGHKDPQIIIVDWKDVSLEELIPTDRARLLNCVENKTCDCSLCSLKKRSATIVS